jgi:HSP20 family protein
MAITPFTRGVLHDFVSLRDVMDRVFDENAVAESNGSEAPFAVDLKEQGDKFELHAALPGARPDDVQIEVTANTISITGEFKREHEQKDGEYMRREIRYGRFHRAFQLPVEIDPSKVDASFRDGVLTVTMPKAETMRPRRIRAEDRSNEGRPEQGAMPRGDATSERSGHGKDKSAPANEVAAERSSAEAAGSTQRGS